MKAGSFILNDVFSETIGTVIQSRPTLHAPRRRMIPKQGYGRSGTDFYDEGDGAYDNTPLELALFTSLPNASNGREILFDLMDSPEYQNLIMYCDPTKIYRVIVSDSIAYESRYFMGESFSHSVKFSVHPYKMLLLTPKVITLTSAGTIINPTKSHSAPLIKVTGSGNITITVNGVPFVLQGVSGHVFIDSEVMFVYKESGSVIINENTKALTKKHPYFSPGVNSVSWTGTVTKLEVTPRWRTLV